MDIKTAFAITAIVVAVISLIVYLKDIFSGGTIPHAYTWLIWSITQGTATAGMWYGGSGIIAINFTIGTILVFGVFCFCLRFGSENITKSDTAVLVTALLATLVWWQLHSPLVAVLMVSAIDVLGYIPSYRKSYNEPWSETLITWTGFVISGVFSILAIEHYNWLTLTYVVAITIANIILMLICLYRRQYISKPVNNLL